MYQAVRNMTRISKLQAAGYIWKVSHANDIKFYAPSDLMPSYIAADKRKPLMIRTENTVLCVLRLKRHARN